MREDMLYPELSYKVMGSCFAVYNALGPFYREDVYQRALEIELTHGEIAFERKKAVDLTYQGQLIGSYQVDLVVGGCIVVELKAVQLLHPQHTSQLIQYLELVGCRLGILVNFGSEHRLTYRRVPH